MSEIIWTPGITLEAMEEQIIKKALLHYRGNKTSASISLGISIRTIDNKLFAYAEAEKSREILNAERKKKDQEFLERCRGIIPTTPNNLPESSTGVSQTSSLSMLEPDGISELLPQQTTSLRFKKSR